MARRVKLGPTAYGGERTALPVNPSVRGTGKQSGRDRKGMHAKRSSLGRTEGSGNRRHGGRGGKMTSRHY